MESTVIKITVTEENKNHPFVKFIQKSAEDKRIIKEHIQAGKKLSDLNERGIKFRKPL
ncbi:MAG: hypothetical protein L3J35_03725 [Bacteroidales bacterium]|nr:hypothetical protein [Bacteroidales bacterium]